MSKLYEALKKIEKKELGRKGDKKIPYTLHRKSTKHLLVIVVFLLIIFGGGFVVVTYTQKKIALNCINPIFVKKQEIVLDDLFVADEIRKLRNRIAHHSNLYSKKQSQEFQIPNMTN